MPWDSPCSLSRRREPVASGGAPSYLGAVVGNASEVLRDGRRLVRESSGSPRSTTITPTGPRWVARPATRSGRGGESLAFAGNLSHSAHPADRAPRLPLPPFRLPDLTRSGSGGPSPCTPPRRTPRRPTWRGYGAAIHRHQQDALASPGRNLMPPSAQALLWALVFTQGFASETLTSRRRPGRMGAPLPFRHSADGFSFATPFPFPRARGGIF